MDRGVVHDLGRIEQDRIRLLHATQNSSNLKTYELLFSGIFRLIFSYQVWLQVSETLESETTDKPYYKHSLKQVGISSRVTN